MKVQSLIDYILNPFIFQNEIEDDDFFLNISKLSYYHSYNLLILNETINNKEFPSKNIMFYLDIIK